MTALGKRMKRRPMRRLIVIKMGVTLGLVLALVVSLVLSGSYAVFVHRRLVKTLSWRAVELPLAAEMSSQVGDLRIMLGELRGMQVVEIPGERRPTGNLYLRDRFRYKLYEFDRTLAEYRRRLEERRNEGSRLEDTQFEWETLQRIERELTTLRAAAKSPEWMEDGWKAILLDQELESLQASVADLPSRLHRRLEGLATSVRSEYRALVLILWAEGALAIVLLVAFLYSAYRWIFRPLQTLIRGSRRVAEGDFAYRIELDTGDEMAELAAAMNDMTARFQAIRSDLDEQVRRRTRQAVRSEQLAGIGFLAAGVAHEINNPLAVISVCAESIEERLAERLNPDDEDDAVVADYLRMIQQEAFRCKEITERLLDFSRAGSPRREPTVLAELVEAVVDMVRHVGKYRGKNIETVLDCAVTAPVCPQQMKQVLLNLVVNALDSIDEQGTVKVTLRRDADHAVLTVADDGCGMDAETLEKIFEPFFTTKRGGQGTGLGLSLTHRIVSEHQGELEAESAGPGKGAVFTVRLPLRVPADESLQRPENDGNHRRKESDRHAA